MGIIVALLVGLLLGAGIFIGKDRLPEMPWLEKVLPQVASHPITPESTQEIPPAIKLLNQFNFEELAQRHFEPGKITLKEVMEVGDTFISYVFTYEVDGKTVSGMANIPNGEGEKFPVIVMSRGFVAPEIYQTGVGTRPSSRVYARNGYITLAPDFLGFGQSDAPENDVWWERFSKPVQVLQLLASIETLDQADPERVGLWGHSNGGQIALSVLEITGKSYPTTLWAPVTKPFPYSVLYFTDEDADEGQSLRWQLNRLEWDYDVKKFSITKYFDRIAAPITLHQGTADDAVPLEWSDEFVAKMKDLDKEITYHVYPAADHDLRGGWDTVVQRDVQYFNSYLKK